VVATTACRQEMQRRRDAYAESRKRWTDAWHRGEPPAPSTDTEAPNRRRSRTIHDRRQYRLDL